MFEMFDSINLLKPHFALSAFRQPQGSFYVSTINTSVSLVITRLRDI